MSRVDLSDPKLWADTPPLPEQGTVAFAVWERAYLAALERTLPSRALDQVSRPRVRPRWLSRSPRVTFRSGRTRGPRTRRRRTARASRSSPSSSDEGSGVNAPGRAA
jgi:hypothetical protein